MTVKWLAFWHESHTSLKINAETPNILETRPFSHLGVPEWPPVTQQEIKELIRQNQIRSLVLTLAQQKY